MQYLENATFYCVSFSKLQEKLTNHLKNNFPYYNTYIEKTQTQNINLPTNLFT